MCTAYAPSNTPSPDPGRRTSAPRHPTMTGTMRAMALGLLLTVSPPLSYAGNNAGGTIRLSWDENGHVTNLNVISSTPFPLFAHISGAPDVRALAIQLVGHPFDLKTGPYRVDRSAPGPHCNGSPSMHLDDPQQLPDGPTTARLHCFQFLVSSESAQEPADLVIASAVVRDSGGMIDTLEVTGGATILGGASRVAVLAVEPAEVSAGKRSRVVLHGRHFRSGANVSFGTPGVQITAASVTLVDEGSILATVDAPNVPGTVLAAVVTLPNGEQSALHHALTIGPPQSGPTTTAVPSTNGAAFRRFHLYGDRIAAVGTVDHVGVSAYPSSLNSNSLLVTRAPGDSVALFDSEPYDAIRLEANDTVVDSYVDYAVTPPQYATSLGLLTMALNVFNGSGGFADYGKTLFQVRTTFVDGDTSSSFLRVGQQIRDWSSGQIFCTGQNPFFYIVPPDDPLAAVVDADDINGRYYDAQVLPLPSSKRSKKIASIRLRAIRQDHFCSSFIQHVYAGGRLHGLSAWVDFAVRNAQGQPVV